jgi:carboxylate-amine ligase
VTAGHPVDERGAVVREPLTVGVEEEFLLADRASGRTVAAAGKVLAQAGGHPFEDAGGRYHHELLDCLVEAATGVCVTLDELHRQIRDARLGLAAAAHREGLLLLSSGTPVLAGRVPVSDGERFQEISRLYAGAVSGYQACGCHVHVGVEDRDAAAAVLNHLRPWLPTLLALSANSPYDGDGGDSGYASGRMIEQHRFPTSGVPPVLRSADDHDRAVERLVVCGVLADPAQSFWLARLSPHLPTVEVRAADAVPDGDEAVLQAALTRALVRTALDDLAAGREARPVDPEVCEAAVWNAARYGLDGPGVHPFEERQIPARSLLEELMRHVAPALMDAGDLDRTTALLADVIRTGSGARRQRDAAARGGTAAVIARLAIERGST